MLIILFSLDLHWLPSFGAVSAFPPYWWGSKFLDEIADIILPLTVLTLVSLATYVRLIRANMLDALRQDYVLGAKASGLSDFKVTYKHALRTRSPPW